MSGLNSPVAGAPDGREDDGDGLRRRIGAPLSALSFWGAIALPVLYLPPLVLGIESTTGLLAFLGLLGLHAAALIGGRGYRRS